MAPKRGKQKIVICIAGMAGCGKSTMAKKLADKYKLRYFSGGGELKALAMEMGYEPRERGWWETEEGARFLKQRTMDQRFDRKVDEELIKEARRGNVVLDSWTMPWLLKQGFKVWLEASPKVRARRIAGRDGISLERAHSALKERDQKTKMIYKNLYGFDLEEDFSPFKLILDTNELGVEEVFQTLCMVIERLLLKKA